MDNYNITGEILVRAVEEYYKDDMEPMYNLLHPDVTFLLPGRDQLIEGRDELRRIMSLERSKEKLAIQNAMGQEDSEVVHYAASYITDVIAKYKESEKRLREICEENKDADTVLIYLQFSDKMLHKNIFSEPEQRMYLNMFEGYMQELYEMDSSKVDGELIRDLIELHREYIKNTDGLEIWIDRAEEKVYMDLAAAKEVLKFYFHKKNGSITNFVG